MALPPLDPGVKLIVACPFAGVATKEVGAEGVVAAGAHTGVNECVGAEGHVTEGEGPASSPVS